MPRLEQLKGLAGESIDPIPPTWPLVHYLMIRHDSPEDGNLGAAVAASGEASLFSYAHDSIAPMYFSTIGASARLKACTGYASEGVRTTDAEEAFGFIRAGIDAGRGVFVAGPEMGLCYGYDDPGGTENRKVYGVSHWGPAFDGAYSWAKFSEHVETFGDAEGFGYVRRESDPESTKSILQVIAMTVVDWQEHHPATKFGMRREFYGLAAFKQFIQDLRDPDTRSQIDDAYINCHAILFQIGGRYWLGQYLMELAERLAGDMRRRLLTLSDLYLEVHEGLKQFQKYDITDGKSETQVQGAIDRLEDAYRADERIAETFIALRKSL